MSISKFYKNHQSLLHVSVCVVIGVLVGVLVASYRTANYQNLVDQQLQDQEEFVLDLARSVAQNQMNESFSVSITDCPADDREKFDLLLGRIDTGLNRDQLLELDNLFAACAHVRAERKAVLVSQLSREIGVLEGYMNQLASITGQQTLVSEMSNWNTLLEYELVQSRGFSDLVDAQKNIIDTLLDGKDADSPEMMTILASVQETQEAILLANTQATALRSALSQR